MKIGIIGGGQLGLMMAEAATELNHEVIGLDPNKLCPLSTVAHIIESHYSDEEAFLQLASLCDVLTYEFENVDLNLIHKYESKIPQKASALEFSRHRMTEKEFAALCHIPIPAVKLYTSNDDLTVPSIIKTTMGGYDGKGQYQIKNKTDIDAFTPESNTEYIVESTVSFDYEISCIMTRDQFGNCEAQPIPVNTHKKGILFLSDVTDTIPKHIQELAIEYTKRIVTQLDYIGTLTVEYFVVGDHVIFNEFAPRPHNSGHFSIEGSTVSQFKNHILAITGQPVQKSSLKQPSLMLNLIGQSIKIIDRFQALNNVFFHDYHKQDIKADRKMGHVTITDSNIIGLKKSLLQILEAVK